MGRTQSKSERANVETGFTWERWQSKGHRHGNEVIDSNDRVYLRCEPSPCLVLDVLIEPPSERGRWFAHWRGRLGMPQGHSATVEKAKDDALDASVEMLREALAELERRVWEPQGGSQ